MTVPANARGKGRITIRATITGNGVKDTWETGIDFDDRHAPDVIKRDLDEALKAIRAKAQEYIQ